MLMDCCHSGTLNRFGIGEPPTGSRISDERARFLPLTPDLEKAYLDFAKSPAARVSRSSNSRSRNALEQTNEVLFTACTSTELAWESNGQGEFTLRATGLLAENASSLTNEAFINAIISAFGAGRRQTPTIACAAALRARSIFAGVNTGAPVRTAESSASTGAQASHFPGRFGPLADAIDGVARQLRLL